jgi:adenylosuccinate synthase
MPVTILIGAQWGDEGKGRFVDYFAKDADIVARYSGGDNAGHTVAVGETVYKMHLIPSGVLHKNVVSVMGNGMVVNPLNLAKEIAYLQGMGVDISPDNLVISTRAHIITPAHIELDKAKEKQRGDEAIGTTLRGIGPAYFDKTGRTGIRVGQMLDIELFGDAMKKAVEASNERLQQDGFAPIDVQKSIESYINVAVQLQPFIKDTSVYLNQRLKQGAKVVSEGAQGTLLDIDHGSYPYVTSSSPTAGGALTGLGIGPKTIESVLGIAKAFSTRVGGGPMPTEQDNMIGSRLRGTGENFWDEFGTTTGRARRCGWLDIVMLRYATAINGFTELALTKLDVLSGFEELKIAVAYELDGIRMAYPPSTAEEQARVTPIYETLAGWQETISGARKTSDLPKNALHYIQRISELVELPIKLVSVGPERTQLVELT